jgi:hypothetical protein
VNEFCDLISALSDAIEQTILGTGSDVKIDAGHMGVGRSLMANSVPITSAPLLHLYLCAA